MVLRLLWSPFRGFGVLELAETLGAGDGLSGFSIRNRLDFMRIRNEGKM